MSMKEETLKILDEHSIPSDLLKSSCSMMITDDSSERTGSEGITSLRNSIPCAYYRLGSTLADILMKKQAANGGSGGEEKMCRQKL